MKKFLITCLLLFSAPVYCFAEWQKLGQGYYMDNITFENGLIKGSYKYTTEFPAFQEEIKKREGGEAMMKLVDNFTTDLTVDCNTKTIIMTGMNVYDKSGNIIYTQDKPYIQNFDSQLENICSIYNNSGLF